MSPELQHLLGALMLVALFAGLFLIIWKIDGIQVALLTYGTCAVIVGFVVIAATLLTA